MVTILQHLIHTIQMAYVKYQHFRKMAFKTKAVTTNILHATICIDNDVSPLLQHFEI